MESKKIEVGRKTYRPNEVAEIFGVSRATVWNYIKDGKLKRKLVSSRIAVLDAKEAEVFFGVREETTTIKKATKKTKEKTTLIQEKDKPKVKQRRKRRLKKKIVNKKTLDSFEEKQNLSESKRKIIKELERDNSSNTDNEIIVFDNEDKLDELNIGTRTETKIRFNQDVKRVNSPLRFTKGKNTNCTVGSEVKNKGYFDTTSIRRGKGNNISSTRRTARGSKNYAV
jgi:predicted transcriptional regulator